MNKLLLILIIVVMTTALNAQSNYRKIYETNAKYLNNILQRDDSVSYQYPTATATLHTDYIKMLWNNPSQGYVNDIKYTYTFNQQGSVTETTVYKWDGTSWEPNSKTARTYNTQNLLTQVSSFDWQSNNWNETNRGNYTYNIQGKTIESVDMNSSGGQLENYRKDRKIYDTQQRLTKDSVFIWNSTNSTWRFTYLNEYFYSVGSSLVDSIRYFSIVPPTDIKKLSQKYFYKYNSNGKETERIEHYDYMGNDSVLPYRRYTNLFDSKENLIESGYKEIKNGQWVDQRRTLIQYDEQNRRAEATFLIFNNALGYIINSSRSLYEYAADSSLITINSFIWANNDWVNYLQSKHAFEPLQQQTDINDIAAISFKAYPNPFTTNTIIEFETAKADEATIQIHDFMGRLVYHEKQYTTAGSNSFLWDAVDKNGNTLPGGMYLLNLSSSSNQQSFTLIKQ